MKFCSECGEPVEFRIPDGDHFSRHVCTACATVHYRNPKVIVGCIPEWEDRVLMCRRNIEPRLGWWTFPAGFMELGETSGEGAARETLEEARADVAIGQLFVVINAPSIGQVYLVHRARMLHAGHGPTPESSETRLMTEAEIPWPDIAFPTVYHSLRYFFEDRRRNAEGFHVLDLPHRTTLNPGQDQ